MYDFIIKNVRILDGTGAPWYRGSIAVKDGRIARIGSTAGMDEPAGEVIDGEDRYLSPGFIDIHCHSDTSLLKYPQAESRILQGVTTEIGGACGLSVAAIAAGLVSATVAYYVMWILAIVVFALAVYYTVKQL